MLYNEFEYFRVTLYNEFVSHIVTELKQLFSSSQFQIIVLLQLLPELCFNKDGVDLPDELAHAAYFYTEDLSHQVMLPMENRMWVL